MKYMSEDNELQGVGCVCAAIALGLLFVIVIGIVVGVVIWMRIGG